MKAISRAVGTSTLALGWMVLAPWALAAQGGGDGFLFEEPRVTVEFHSGFAMPQSSGDIFDFVEEELTLARKDFISAAWGGEISVRAAPRWDIGFSVGVLQSESTSEFREWVDQDDLPIEQVTTFKRVPFTATVRYYLSDRGRKIGRFAWVPTTVQPFVGASAGGMWYRFEQRGDFVDFETLDIFSSLYRSDETTATGGVFGGADFAFSPQFLIRTQARYDFASAPLLDDFVGFDDINLNGLQMTVGVALRF